MSTCGLPRGTLYAERFTFQLRPLTLLHIPPSLVQWCNKSKAFGLCGPLVNGLQLEGIF